MSVAATSIEWTDSTWNATRGCSRVSEGCRLCYAERIAARFRDTGQPFHGFVRTQANGEPQWTGKMALVESALDQPLRWKKPRRIFVNSMSDLFHENLPDVSIDRVFAVMALASRHTFQVLTKRPERMAAYMARLAKSIKPLEAAARELGYTLMFRGLDGREYSTVPWPLPAVWLGVSVENQETVDTRIPFLLQTPAAVRFLSVEPLLSSIDLARWLNDEGRRGISRAGSVGKFPARTERSNFQHLRFRQLCPAQILEAPAGLIHWVIVGGESGPHARPMHPDWARSIRDQCIAASVPFFFKQWGAWIPVGEGEDPRRVGKKIAGRILDGRTWDEFPTAREKAERIMREAGA